jgi:phosphoribosylaminoimidazole carboxylase (NCAIR synthetase)
VDGTITVKPGRSMPCQIDLLSDLSTSTLLIQGTPAPPAAKLPDRDAVLALPGAHLHVYGKAPRRGRKLGHVTCVATSRQEADAVAARVAALPAADGA